MSTPNYELLREAYAIIGGIPSRQFDLGDIVKRGGYDPTARTIACGTLACAAGWLAMHPMIQDVGDLTVQRGLLRVRSTGGYACYASAMAKVFGISYSDAELLFNVRGEGYLGEDAENDFKGGDKKLWLARVRTYLEERGQLTAQLEAKKAQALDEQFVEGA